MVHISSKEFKPFKLDDFLKDVKIDSLVEFEFYEEKPSDGLYKGIDHKNNAIFLQRTITLERSYKLNTIKGYRIKQ